ncbi:uncharacterized protein [Montipora capricornis]|uniref:uncharacterized protein n=1 Tax=Montipora capricornis TaxID=246305 RepID=UPI0035F1A418
MAEKDSNWLYRWFGYASGNVYRINKEWKQEPEWLKASYRLEMEYLSGDIDTPLKAAAKALIEGTGVYAKMYPLDAAQMGKEIAKIANITPAKGLAFAQGFVDSAKSK